MKSIKNYSEIRGFNYQPSHGSSGFELWRRFDRELIRSEIERGKKYFPGMNAVRFWLSWEAFVREPEVFADNFEASLGIFEDNDLQVMPVLFNRWHDNVLDYGGIYAEHFMPGNLGYREEQFDAYIKSIVGSHNNDPRIFMWDLCNEPSHYDENNPEYTGVARYEYLWLERIYRLCKQARARAPLTVGTLPTIGHLRRWASLSDVLCTHPYAMADWSPPPAYEDNLQAMIDYAREQGKELLATETCWGSLDDTHRVEIIRYTLSQLKKHKIGWLVYLLNHSLIADAHRLEFGPLGSPGNLAFIEADGSVRPGHEIFNEF